MPKKISDIETLKKYISGVMDRSHHHAAQVEGIVLALAGAVIWKKDSKPLEVISRNEEMKNVLWVYINGKRYAFSYNHNSLRIDMRRNSIKAGTIASFDNNTTLAELKDFFEKL